MCMFALTGSIVEPKTLKKALADSGNGSEAIQDELNQFRQTKSLGTSLQTICKMNKAKEGNDFENHFAPIARLEALDFPLPYAATQVLFPIISWT
ncbi:hypothetical protein Tco_0836703 [Tanacetum coccineum]